MPIFEYVCGHCRHPFEAIVSAARQPECPKCHSQTLEKQLSVFAVSTASPSKGAAMPSPAPCGSCGDPRGQGSCRLN